jgi:diaminohydroxyphosphoribosylaminopyrimidine deaminase/5-amino-6-(5-phosphoribosylamino)uracil reductase
MDRAIALAASVRTATSPNPWVGCVLEAADGRVFEGATNPPGGPHAEAMALAAAGSAARGATAWVTLEPCSHEGRTPPCADVLIAAGVARVVIGIEDPDPKVRGAGIARLREAGIEVEVGVAADVIAEQLAPYVKHRTTGRPWVVLKLAASLDGRTAAPDGSSQWITGEAARADAHRLRAESDAVPVRTDDPSLTVRHVEGPDPLRVVLGSAPAGAKVHPCLELSGALDAVLDELGGKGILQVLVEGGASVAGAFHRAGLVDRYVLYVAPVLFGGEDARSLLAGEGAPTIDDAWRGRVVSVHQVGTDLRIEVSP